MQAILSRHQRLYIRFLILQRSLWPSWLVSIERYPGGQTSSHSAAPKDPPPHAKSNWRIPPQWTVFVCLGKAWHLFVGGGANLGVAVRTATRASERWADLRTTCQVARYMKGPEEQKEACLQLSRRHSYNNPESVTVMANVMDVTSASNAESLSAPGCLTLIL